MNIDFETATELRNRNVELIRNMGAPCADCLCAYENKSSFCESCITKTILEAERHCITNVKPGCKVYYTFNNFVPIDRKE